MRVIYETNPAPVTIKDAQGQPVTGTFVFSVLRYEPSEMLPTTPDGDTPARPLAYWRGNAPAGHALEVNAPPGLPAAVIPAAVLANVADDIHLTLQWQFTREGVRP